MKSVKLLSIASAVVITLSACQGMTPAEQRIATNAAGGAAGAAIGAELGGTGGAAIGGALGAGAAEAYQQNQGR